MMHCKKRMSYMYNIHALRALLWNCEPVLVVLHEREGREGEKETRELSVVVCFSSSLFIA